MNAVLHTNMMEEDHRSELTCPPVIDQVALAIQLSFDSCAALSSNSLPPPLGVVNLGNTCYMNAALQALAHAPELCHALDAECHIRRCPIALRNETCGSSSSNTTSDIPLDYEICTLCELERLLRRVHSRPTHTEGPFVPEAFVSGFMSKVAPWFRRGVQEDSHEFLRLLIDAMQNSCMTARAATVADGGGSPSSTAKSRTGGKANLVSSEDDEYPFRLFRGTVESNVTCSACQATSCKIDPIEDIGLDILPVRSADDGSIGGGAGVATHNRIGSTGGNSSMSSSRSTSPTTNMPLADVTQALERFISTEHLDSGYKCKQCGELGKATKTSKLASIPPILTLHLKRFRYGSGKKSHSGGGVGAYHGDNGGGARSTNIGPSGSAKIEGHVGFGPVLDVKPYLTPQLQQTVFQRAICRLFAVVVHSGKNSHSGHYVAYVHNVTKK